MSLSISDILNLTNATKKKEELQNPDIPEFKKKFDDRKEIRDKAFSALKLSSMPRNGTGYLLPRTVFNDDPRQDAFLMNGAIDPNVIRKRVNPDKAIPSLESGESTKFSLVPENVIASNKVGLIQSANKNYVNYKNRFFVEDKRNPIKPKSNENIDTSVSEPRGAGRGYAPTGTPNPVGMTGRHGKTAIPTKADFEPIILDTGDDEIPEYGESGASKGHQKTVNTLDPQNTNIPNSNDIDNIKVGTRMDRNRPRTGDYLYGQSKTLQKGSFNNKSTQIGVVNY